MPSGSKKRKASKKPKAGEPPSSQGEPPELETGLEESMAKDGEEMVEGSSSPKAMDEATEAMAEGGVEEGKELEGDEVDDLEEASTPPPSQTELELEIPTISGAEAPDGSEVAGEAPVDLAQIPPGETEPESDALPAEIKSEVEVDAVSTEIGDVTNDAGTSCDVAPLAHGSEPKEAAGSEPHEAQIGSEPRLDESLVEVRDVAQEDTEPESDPTPPAMITVEVDEAPVEINPVIDAAPVDTQPENDEATELDTDAASPNIEPDGTDVTLVETAADTDECPAIVQSEMDEAVVERQLETDAVPKNLEMDDQPDIDEDPPVVREFDADTPADVEPASGDEVSFEATAQTDEGPSNVQPDMEEAVVERQLEADAVPGYVEPETTAESELEKDIDQVEGDASTGENPQDGPSIDLQTDASACDIEASTDAASAEIEPETDITMRELEPETEPSPVKIKSKLEATLGDTEKDEVSSAETKPKVNATQPDIEPELEERTSIEVEPELEAENVNAPLETEADALKEIEPEPDRSREASEEVEAETGPTAQEDEYIVDKAEPAKEDSTETSEVNGSKEDLNQGVETPLELDTEPEEGTTQEVEQEVDKAESANEALNETLEVKGSEDLNQGVETSEPEGGIELEAVAEVPALGPAVKVGYNESDQQDLVEIQQDQPIVNDYEAESGVEAPESEADQVEISAVSTADKADLVDASASFVPDEANAEIGVPPVEQESMGKLEEGEASGEVLKGEGGDAADMGIVVDSDQGAVDGRLDESEDYIVEQERAAGGDEEKASLGGVNMTVIPSEKESGIELPPADIVEVPVGEEPHEEVSSGESEKVEQGSNATLPPEPEMARTASEPKDGVDFEQELNFVSPSGDVERDIREEEAASSTVAEVGSVLNDFDESASYQQLVTEFPSSDQDACISESRDFDDMSAVEGLTEQIDGECDEHAQAEQERCVGDQTCGGDSIVGDSPKKEVEWKAAQDSEFTSEHEKFFPDSAKTDDQATNLAVSLNTLPVDVYLSEEGNAKDKEANMLEAGGGCNENGQEAAPQFFGIDSALELVAVTEDLMRKVLPSDTNGEHSFDDNAAVNTAEAEIRTVESEDLKTPSGEDFEKNFSQAPLQSALPGRDIEDVQTFRQQNTQETSLPVVVPTQDVKQRALEQVNLKSNEPPSGGATLKGRNKFLGCCGMFDLLLGRN